jgi:hypothetical protein
MSGWAIAGIVVQAFGIVLAGAGAWRTWRADSPNARQRWLRRIIGNSEHTVTGTATATVHLSGYAEIVGRTDQQRIDDMRATLDRLERALAQGLQDVRSDTDRRISERLRAFSKDGLGQEAVGLVIAFVGTLLPLMELFGYFS